MDYFAFFSLMYMRPEIQKKAFAKAFRVPRRRGHWIVWYHAIPLALEKGTRGPVFRFRFHLHGKVVETEGCGPTRQWISITTRRWRERRG
jgi:hypothetical protein